jgi:hypothetical protein
MFDMPQKIKGCVNVYWRQWPTACVKPVLLQATGYRLNSNNKVQTEEKTK